MTTKERVKFFCKQQGVSVSDFEKGIGVANGYVNSISRGIGEDKLSLILEKYPNVSIEWLLLGKGEMLKSAPTQPNIEVVEFRTATSDNKKSDTVPLYSTEALCGIVAMLSDAESITPIDYITIPNLPAADGAVHVTGDSMYPLLKAGDIVIYKILNDKANILWGEMYLLSFVIEGDSFTTVKYVQKSDQEGMVCLVSQNQHHQSKDIPFDSIRFAALVKASVRINSMD